MDIGTAATIDGQWLRPGSGPDPREPRWGHPEGMQIGLHPLRGPRGLIRIFTPYLGQPRERLLNFVAVEPIPVGSSERGFSELEQSRLDEEPGLRFWTVDDPYDATPQRADRPSRGRVEVVDGVERLTVHILVEPFVNGAHVGVTAKFRADRPHEVTFATDAFDDSVDLEACILTATMGNWARLRVLHLADRDVTAGDLWPDYRDVNFAEHARFPVGELRQVGDAVEVTATPDEAEPENAEYAPGTLEHWHYAGRRAAQTWRVREPDPCLVAQVNGRYTYWRSASPLPGGIAFENVELVTPFRQGQEFTFVVDELPDDSTA